MVPADGLGDFWPGELNAADNLVADDSMIRHLAKFFGIERAGLAEQAAVDGDFADVVQISGAAQRSNFAWFHTHGFADGGGISAYAQGVAVNIYVLDVDSGGESLQSIIVKAMQRGHQAQVF